MDSSDFFFLKHFVPKLITAIFLTISLPLFTALSYFIFAETISYIMGISSTTPLSHIIEIIYISAYGTNFGIELQHFFIAEELGSYSNLKNFMWSLSIINGAILAVGFAFLYKFYFQIISTITKNNVSLNENPITGYLGNLFLMAFTYHFCMPFIFFTSELPYGLNMIIVWSILLFPFLGIRIALTNRHRKNADKNGKIFTYYYIAFFLLLVSFALYKDGLSNINLNLLFLLAPLGSFYILISSITRHRKS
jgi:hypothetical protein